MIGQTISHYKILEKLGEGGMGVVYKAHDTKLDRVIALKFLPHYLTTDTDEKERFYHEARAASGLNHANITTIYEIQEFDDQLFLAMEFVEGKTLKQLVKEDPPSIKTVLDIAIQMCEGIAVAHEKGIVHRDIKSDNIMITAKGQVKIMDFGLAKVKGATKLTKAGSTLGTAAYMSPEQAQGEEVDQRSDIFSVGVVLYELLAGQLPFKGEHHAALMYSLINEEPMPLIRYNPKVTPELERIVSKALTKDKAERYQHADDLLADLRRERKQLEYARAGYVTSPTGVFTPQQIKKKNSKLKFIIPAVMVIIGVAVWYFMKPADRSINSIAVLPFTAAASDSSLDYVYDGVTEGIINSLSKLPSLTVMSRNSVFKYKGVDVDVQEVGKKLNVSAILLGRIVRHGNDLTISAELVDATKNSHIWGDQYSRSLSDLASLQSDISKEISNQLKITLTGDQQKELAKHVTENGEAYQLYLKGRYYWNKRNRDGFEKAIQYFRQAIDKDPTFASAYAGLGDTYDLMANYFFMNPKEAVEQARAFTQKALALDPTLAEAHVTLASIAESFDWDWNTADREYAHAIELAPNYPTAHQWYGEFLEGRSHPEKAFQELSKAIELDPLAPVLYTALGNAYYTSRRYDEAIVQLRKSLEIEPDFSRAYAGIAYCYLLKGMNDSAIQAMQKAIVCSDSSIEYIANLGALYGFAGKQQEAKKILAGLLERNKREYLSPFLIGIQYLGLNDNDQAFFWLNKAIDDREPEMEYLNVDPGFDRLRNDPRFDAIVKRVGLP